MRLYHALPKRAFVASRTCRFPQHGRQFAWSSRLWDAAEGEGKPKASGDPGRYLQHDAETNSTAGTDALDLERNDLSNGQTKSKPVHWRRTYSDRPFDNGELVTPTFGKADGPVASDQSTLVEDLRSLLRLTPTSVVIVIAGYSPESDNEAAGMLVGSFAPITLHPVPYVSFNIKLPSHTHDQMLRTGTFMVLAPDNAMLSAEFAQQGSKHSVIKDIMSKLGRPFKNRGVLWWAQCELLANKTVNVGDHIIVIGRVKEVGRPASAQRQHVILYADGKYRELGPAIHPHDDAFHIEGKLHSKGIREEEGGPLTQEARKSTSDSGIRAKEVTKVMIQEMRRVKESRGHISKPKYQSRRPFPIGRPKT